MSLLDIIQRAPAPQPWGIERTLPWDDPDFSERMLDAHLSQAYDAASRRTIYIEQQLDWIERTCLAGKKGNILDLACGPGLYTTRLARRGHRCRGIDFSPASIRYAREQQQADNLSCDYLFDNVITAEYGSGYDLVMMIFGQFNTFRPDDSYAIIQKAAGALADGGVLLLEPHTYEFVHRFGHFQPRWHTQDRGLFSEEPYLVLLDYAWHEDLSAATERHFVVDARTGHTETYVISLQAIARDDFKTMLETCGLGGVRFHASIGTSDLPAQDDFMGVTARKFS